MLVVLTGIPGAGKTTVAKKAMSILETQGIKYNLVTYGDVMIEIAKSKNLAQDRDEMRKLKLEEQREIQRLAAKSIAEMSVTQNIVLDTHCTIKTPKGYLPGLPEWVLRELKPDIILIIESTPEEIAQRRQGDATRTRDVELEDEIRLHQEMNRSIAVAYSVFTGATVRIIQNPQNRIGSAVNEMIELLKF